MLARRQASVQIMIDTGMTRAGVVLDDINRLLKRVQSHASLRLSGFYTHFACADDLNDSYTHEQMRRFRAATDGLVREIVKNGKPPLRHAANSAGLFFLPVSHMDMIRPGISLYGIDPSGRPSVDRPLRPVMKWVAPLIGVRELKRGGTVGYGRTWTADRDARIGLVPVGYGDGYRRALSNRGVMLVAGRPAPVVGRVSMDLTTIDLTGIPDARIGDEVTILDDDALSPCSVYQLARLADTIPYEILCGIGQRVKRVAVEPQPAEAMP
jgi:alanine racemase